MRCRASENRIRCPYAEALETHRVALAIEQSAREGRAIDLVRARGGRTCLSSATSARSASSAAARPISSAMTKAPPGDGQVRLDMLYTGFSAGTELTFLKNTNPYLHSRWDAGRGVFVPGEPSAHYPGAVPRLHGSARASAKAACRRLRRRRRRRHAPSATRPATPPIPFHDLLVQLPAEHRSDPRHLCRADGADRGQRHPPCRCRAARAQRRRRSATGIARPAGAGDRRRRRRHARPRCSRKRAGASEVVVADPSPFRRLRAECLGLTAMAEDEAWAHAKARWHHGGDDRGADVVFQTRADAASLHAALQALRPQGTVIDLAFYQGGADRLRLGEEFHHNGLDDPLRADQPRAARARLPVGPAPAGRRDGRAAARRAATEIKAQLITHVVPFDEAPAFLAHLVARAARIPADRVQGRSD